MSDSSIPADPPAGAGRVLQVGGLVPRLTATLAADYDALQLPAGDGRAALLAEHGAQVSVAVTSGGVGVRADLMEQLPNLKAIVNFGVGYDTTDVVAARARGIVVSNTPDVLTDCTADTAVGLVINVLRQFAAADRFVRRGDWLSGGFPLATRLRGRRVGVIGLGRIGTAIAHRLEAFGMTIAYHNRKPVDGVPYRYVGSALELASTSEVLVVAAAGGEQSRGLVSREVLEALGDGFIVNIARGSVIDQDALVELLLAGRLGGAGLDVYLNEPRVPEELFALDSVVLLPHVGSATHETRDAMSDLVLRNLAQFLKDGSLLTPVP